MSLIKPVQRRSIGKKKAARKLQRAAMKNMVLSFDFKQKAGVAGVIRNTPATPNSRYITDRQAG
jgi:hypothetical protein